MGEDAVMELRQLRYLLAVADAGSFTAGARRAFVTQPTLSASVAALEAELGMTLLERGARGARLTTEGRQAVEQARAVLRHVEALKTMTRAPTQRPLRVGLLATLSSDVIVATLALLHDHLGPQQLRLEDAPATVLRRRLTAGRLDVVLTNVSASDGARRLELATDTMALAFATATAPTGPVTADILDGSPLVVRTHCELLEQSSRVLDDRRIRPIITVRTDSDARALALVGAGHGACFIPDSFHADGTTIVAVADVALHRSIGLQWTDHASDRLDRLLDSVEPDPNNAS